MCLNLIITQLAVSFVSTSINIILCFGIDQLRAVLDFIRLFPHNCFLASLTCFSCFHVNSYANSHLTQRVDISDISVTFIALSHSPEDRVKPSWAHFPPGRFFIKSSTAPPISILETPVACSISKNFHNYWFCDATTTNRAHFSFKTANHAPYGFCGKVPRRNWCFFQCSIIDEKVWGRSRMFWFEDFDKNREKTIRVATIGWYLKQILFLEGLKKNVVPGALDAIDLCIYPWSLHEN